MTSMKTALTTLCLVASLGLAHAGTLTLQASIEREVAPDEVRLNFYVEQEGPQVGILNQRVLEQLDRVRAQVPSSVVWQTRSLSSRPVYDDKGRTNRWAVRADFEVRGALGPATDQALQVLSRHAAFSGLSYSVSTKRQRELEENMMQELGARIQTRGLSMARALGYSSTELVEARLLQEGQVPPVRPLPLMTMSAAKAAPDLSQQAGLLTLQLSMEATLKLTK